MNKLSVVVPSRNGLNLLKKFLPVIIRETIRAQGEIIVVDDCSDDGTSNELPDLFPQVILLSRRKTPGFCHAVNLGMSRASGNYLMLINNDTIPSENSFRRLVSDLDKADSDVAVVVPSILRPDGSDDSMYSWIFRHGLAVTGENISGENYPSGACALWKRSVWEELGGLSVSYAPIYWEDTDMGVRMHNSGYVMLRCGDIIVEHKHAATMGSSLVSETLRERNRFVFMDKNCHSSARRMSRAFWLPIHLLLALLSGNKAFINGYRDYLKIRRTENEK